MGHKLQQATGLQGKPVALEGVRERELGVCVCACGALGRVPPCANDAVSTLHTFAPSSAEQEVQSGISCLHSALRVAFALLCVAGSAFLGVCWLADGGRGHCLYVEFEFIWNGGSGRAAGKQVSLPARLTVAGSQLGRVGQRISRLARD